jgi:uncharacterized protein YkwD
MQHMHLIPSLNVIIQSVSTRFEADMLAASGAHALQASPLQHGGRRLMQRQMLGEPEPTMKWLVDKHNELRARHGVPPMVWDWGLAWNAYNYVLNCPSGHSGQPGIGENLACK